MQKYGRVHVTISKHDRKLGMVFRIHEFIFLQDLILMNVVYGAYN